MKLCLLPYLVSQHGSYNIGSCYHLTCKQIFMFWRECNMFVEITKQNSATIKGVEAEFSASIGFADGKVWLSMPMF